MDQEQQYYEKLAQQIQHDWDTNPRWFNVTRPYKAIDVAQLRPTQQTTYISKFLSEKLFKLLIEARNTKTFHQTYGALDPVQVINLAKYLKTIYVSGWQCASTAASSNEPGPDFADYPYDTVPKKVDQLIKALAMHDRKQNEARSRMTTEERKKTPKVDYLVPIIADGDCGFGGVTSLMKLIKMFIESGAAGVHIEDQRPGTKKCGHMAGKVIVSVRDHAKRLVAARLQSDIMDTPTIIVARCDGLGAKLIDSNIDPLDHPWIMGINDPFNPKNLVTFPEAGKLQIKQNFKGKQQEDMLNDWKNKCYEMSLYEAQKYAKERGFEFYFDWETSRTDEGFYPLKNQSVKFCARRAREYLKYADVFWMETDMPKLAIAKKLSAYVKQDHPTKLLCYNLSPSFNWSAAGMTDKEIEDFCMELGKLGFVWQFITLAGFHMDALISEQFSKAYAEKKMLAYVQDIQRKEQEHGVDQLKHQKWSGAEYADKLQVTVMQNENISSTTKDSTEHQFVPAQKH